MDDLGRQAPCELDSHIVAKRIAIRVMQNALTSGICRSATVPDHLEEAIVVDTARQATQTREDCTDDWLATFQTAFVPPDALPPISALASLLEEQLPSKVPLASKTLERWSGLLSSALRGLFVRNELKTCKAMKRLLVQMAECSPCGGSSTTSYIWFWDSLIRRVLEFVLVTASVERDSSELRPHFLLFLDKECVFRGWEGSGESDVATLRRALESKTSWSFGDDVPYVFGYVAAGELVQLYALSPYSAEKTKIASHLLAQYDLEHKAQRFQLLLALLNLCRLMPTVVNACPMSSRGEFATVQNVRDQRRRLADEFVNCRTAFSYGRQ